MSLCERRIFGSFLVALLEMAALGCSAPADPPPSPPVPMAHFDEAGFSFVFDYPSTLKLQKDAELYHGNRVSDLGLFALVRDRQNRIIVGSYPQPGNVRNPTPDQARPRIEKGISEVTLDQNITGTEVLVGGLPGLEYNVSIKFFDKGQLRATRLFDGEREYQINCESDELHRTELAAACQAVLSSLRRR